MAVAYKGFQLWVVDAATLENIAYLRDFEYTITSSTTDFKGWTSRTTLEQSRERLSAAGIDVLQIISITTRGGAANDEGDALRSLIPATVSLEPFTGYANQRLKTVNPDSGYYAISGVIDSSSLVPIGSWSFYNDTGTLMGQGYFIFRERNQCGFSCITDFDGTVPNSGNLRMPSIAHNSNGYLVANVGAQSLNLTPQMALWFNSIGPLVPPPPPDTDPYAPGGYSDHTGGGGGFDSTSDPVDFPPLPTLSAIGTGFVTLYVPTAVQIQNLAQYMWNADLATLDFWKKIVADPIDLILGLNIVPVLAPVAGQRSVNVGFIDTGVSMNYTNSQYVEVDCGSIQVPEYWGAYLDYSPYTRIEIYLPYCGYHAIDADEVVGKTVHVKYHVDIISGSLVAYVKCDNSVLYEFAGSCASSIPVTSSQYGDQVVAAATLFAQVVSLPAAGMAASAGAAGAAKAMQAAGENPDNYRKNIEAANVADQWADAASTITKMKPNIARSGVIGGMAGQLSIQKPYLVITRPRQSLPAGQNRYKGYPSNITSKLGDLSGFTEVSNIHLENIPCTLDEQSEIDQFLKTGVII